MKRRAHVIIFFSCIVILYLLTNSSFFLNAQPGWTEDVRLTYRQGYSYDPRAACCDDTIHLVWWEGYVHEEVFYKRSTDAGETWGEDVLLSIENDDASVQPTVGVDGNFVHAVWKDEHAGVCYRKSTDGGDSWLQIDTLPNAGLSEPWIYVDSNNLYVVSGAGSGFQVFTKSTDNGNTWQPGQNVMHSCGAGRIEKAGSSILVISHQDNPYSVEVYCLRSTDDGQTWCDTICVSQYDSVSGQRPAMDTDDSSGIHIAWYDYKYSPYPWTGDVFYRASRDSGNSWQEIDSLTVMHRAVRSDILAEGANLHLVWEDDRHDFNDNFEIYYRMSMDLGQSWTNEERLTNASGWSRTPALAYGNGYLHLFWSDQRDDPVNRTDEIYYKRKNLTGVSEVAQANISSLGLSLDCATILTNDFIIKYDLGLIQQAEIMIVDATGRVVAVFPVYQSSGKLVIGFRSELQNGIYFLMLRAGDGYVIEKVLVVR